VSKDTDGRALSMSQATSKQTREQRVRQALAYEPMRYTYLQAFACGCTSGVSGAPVSWRCVQRGGLRCLASAAMDARFGDKKQLRSTVCSAVRPLGNALDGCEDAYRGTAAVKTPTVGPQLYVGTAVARCGHS
jgi:hypothetical protein